METEQNAVAFDVSQLPDLLAPNKERIRVGQERQKAVWQGQKPDQWPIIMSAPLTESQEKIPAPNLKEAFYDNDLMLCSQTRAACGLANSGSDAVPAIRANLGTGVLLSCLGLEQDVFEDKMPWLQEHLSKDAIRELTPDDICVQGTFKRGLEQMRHFEEIMGDDLAVFCMDTQGPFDLAHLMLGDEVFLAMYDDPPFYDHLMTLCVELGRKTHLWMKELIGEPNTAMHHGGGLYTESAGIRICEDTTIVVGPDMMEEKVMPYSRQLARMFGGAYMHYCGRNDHLTRMACEYPEFRGVNFGHVPSNEQNHVLDEDMRKCADTGTVYHGGWPKEPEESGKDYLRRLHGWAKEGAIIPVANDAMQGDDFEDVSQVLDFWYSLP